MGLRMKRKHLISYVKFCFFPFAQAKKMLLTIILPNLFLFVIFGFSHLLSNEIRLASQMYNEDTVYTDVSDFLTFDEALQYQASQKRLLQAEIGIISEGFSIRAQTYMSSKMKRNLYPVQYFEGNNEFEYLFGQDFNVLGENSYPGKNTVILSSDMAKYYFLTTNCVGERLSMSIEGSHEEYEFIVSKVIEPAKDYKHVFGKSPNYRGKEIVIANFGETAISKMDISDFSSTITFAYRCDKITADDVKLFKQGLTNFYCNEMEYQLYSYSFSYFFELINVIGYFAIVLCVVNLLILIVTKSQQIKQDFAIRKTMFENTNDKIVGYGFGFSFLYVVGLSIAFLVYLVMELLIYCIYKDFFLVNSTTLIVVLLELFAINLFIIALQMKYNRDLKKV